MHITIFLSVYSLAIYILSLVKVNNVVNVIIISSATVAIAVAGDCLLLLVEQDIIRAIVDSCTHGLIGLLSWALVIFYNRSKIYFIYEILICGILSSLVDIDHFIKAKSIYVRDALHQEYRAWFHCSTIPLVILIFNILFASKRYVSVNISRFLWMLWVAFASHHIRDANRRGLWFYPIGSTPPLPDILYILMTVILPFVTACIMNYATYSHFLPKNLFDTSNFNTSIV